MQLTVSKLDELFAAARRLQQSESSVTCLSCAAPLVLLETARRCRDCGTTNIVFKSCFAACEAIAALRAMPRIVVAPTAYVPRLGWLVGFASVRRASRAQSRSRWAA
jgi:hypothetical protein